MKQQQMRVLMTAMAALLIFAAMIALLMYSKQRDMRAMIDEQVNVFVAARPIAAGEKIGADALKAVKLPKSALGFKPLPMSEIVGRYAASELLESDPFRQSRLLQTPPETVRTLPAKPVRPLPQKMEPAAEGDLLNIPLTLFQNIDPNLKVGDRIDIVSVTPKLERKSERIESFKTKYIALDVKIAALTHRGSHQQQMSRPAKDADGKGVQSVTADTLTLDMAPGQIRNFLTLYYETQQLNKLRPYNDGNKNHGHLWMVKCGEAQDMKLQELKKRMLADAKPVRTRYTAAAKKTVEISYEE